MHILLTDLLTCPRCGPAFGLILMADHLEDRRIGAGRLGCANCRESYPIEEGVADLRHPAVPAVAGTDSFGDDEERLYRTAALLGAPRTNGTVLVVDADGSAAASISVTLDMVHVIGMIVGDEVLETSSALDEGTGALSQVRAGIRIPVRDQSLHGVALLGIADPALHAEAARVLVPAARVVIDPAPAGVAESLRALGFEVQLEQEGVVVAAAPGRR